MKRILLNTPDNRPDRRAGYGGGHGGYVRMSGVILNTFESSEFEIVPCFHSVRRAGRWEFLRLPKRLISDVRAVTGMADGAAGLHLTLQYRGAIYREYAISMAARRLGLPVLVDVRAGAFRNWFESTSSLNRTLTHRVFEYAKVISVEGTDYMEFIKNEFGRDSEYLPNFVPSSEIPVSVSPKLVDAGLRVLFVGYAYDGKGVEELVIGCERAAEQGVEIELTFVGSESLAFSDWISRRSPAGRLTVNRLGAQPHDRILELYDQHDIFCLPTRHPGEGHSNAINEAMMMGMVIVTTRHGFIPAVLGDESAYYVGKNSPADICSTLVRIDGKREEALSRADSARRRVAANYSSDAVIPKLEQIYRRLTT